MRSRKALFFLLLFSVFLRSTNSQALPRTLTNADVINMAKSGIGEQTIILSIQESVTKVDTAPDALIQVKTAGVSDAVMNAMLTASPVAAPMKDAKPEDCSQTLDKVLATLDVDGLRTRLRKMSDEKLRKFGKAARYM